MITKAIASVLLSLIGAAPDSLPEPARDAAPLGVSCNGVEIHITNNHSTYDYINILRIEYRVAPNGSWHNEALDNEMLSQGEDHTWNNQNLQHAAEGSYLNFRVWYRLIDIYEPNTVYLEESQFFDKSTKQCNDGHNYHFVIDE